MPAQKTPTHFLNKLILLLYYLCIVQFKYSSSTNTYQRKKRRFNLRFVLGLLPVLIYFEILINNVELQFSSNLTFFLETGLALYIYLAAILVFTIIISNRINEHRYVLLFNLLDKFYKNLDFQDQKHWKESFAQKLIFVEIVYRFIVMVYRNFSHSVAQKSLVNALSHCFVYYMSVIVIVSEGTFLFTGLAIGKYFSHLNKKLYSSCYEKQIRLIMRQHQNLYDLALLFNKTYSVVLLMLNGFYFVTILLRIMFVYCNMQVQKDLFVNVEIVGICFSLLKLTWLITISDDCAAKVIFMFN